jgi:glycosyltransferase involved in cell wall biosynthesis
MKHSARHSVLMLLENNPYPQDGRVRREAVALTKAGFSVTVIAPASRLQPKSEVIDSVTVRRYRATSEPRGSAGYVIEYGYSIAVALVSSIRIFARSGFAVIHAHNPPDLFFLIGWLFKPFGVQFVFDHHDLSPEMYEVRFPGGARAMVKRVLLFAERRSLRTANRVISTNESYASIAVGRGSIDRSRVVVVRNGPDTERVRVVPPDPETRAKAPYILGYLGEMAPHDGVDHLIRGLAHLVQDRQRHDFHCVLMGGGNQVDRLKSLAVELEVDSYTSFLGHVGDADMLMSYLSATDICVTPDPKNAYTDNSTTVKTAEYMALGKPVVAFDLRENRRTAGDAALYATPNDDADLAAKIETLMDDSQLRDTLGTEGRRRVESELAWRYQAEKLVAVYIDLLGRPDDEPGEQS